MTFHDEKKAPVVWIGKNIIIKEQKISKLKSLSFFWENQIKINLYVKIKFNNTKGIKIKIPVSERNSK